MAANVCPIPEKHVVSKRCPIFNSERVTSENCRGPTHTYLNIKFYIYICIYQLFISGRGLCDDSICIYNEGDER